MALILASFVLLPLVEIALFIQVGKAIGLGATLALVIIAGLAGICLIRLHGFAAFQRVRACLERGEPPAGELFDALCIFLSGTLLLIPGFASDAIALALLIPAVRRALRQWLGGRLTDRRRGATRARGQTRRPVIDADFTVVDVPSRRRSPWERPAP